MSAYSVRATPDERVRPLPGDELIAEPLQSLTHAITIRCASDQVWPWLAQMGAGRGGWYSYDAIDNGGKRSAERIIPELQTIEVGYLFPWLPGASEGFTLLACEPGHALVLGAVAPDGSTLVTWAFVLEPRTGGVTRLIVRARGSRAYRFHGLPDWVTRRVVPAGHFVMERRQLLGIARRAEAVEDLELRAACGEAAVDAQIERLGLAFQIATRLTSWVAVSEEPAVDPTQPSRRERIPHALPSGLSVEGLGLRGTTGMIACQSVRSARVLSPPSAYLKARLSQRLGQRSGVSDDRPDLEMALRVFADVTTGLPTLLTGRLVRQEGRDLVIEIALDRPIDWDPKVAEVVWSDGTRLAATIDARLTTRRGRFAAGLLIRLDLRLDGDGPPRAPAEVLVMSGGSVRLVVTLVAR